MMSKKFRIVISREAFDMINEHVAFLANVSTSAARVLRQDLLARIKLLVHTPYLYPVCYEVQETKFRKFIFKRYIILYSVNEEEKLIEVEYIWDARRNNEI